MATHDYIISNASGAAVRADLNNALAAIVSNNSNATSPSTTYAFQFWADTTASQLKIRNAANSAWITLMELDGTMLMEDGTVSAPGLAFASDTNTGFFRSAADKINFATGGAERLEIGSSEVVINDPSNDLNFRVVSNNKNHMLFVDGGNDKIGINTSSPGCVSGGIHVVSENAEGTPTASGAEAAIFQRNFNSSQDCHIAITAGTAGASSINFGDKDDGDIGIIKYEHNNNAMAFSTNAEERVRIDSSGNCGLGTSTPSNKLNVIGTVDVDSTKSGSDFTRFRIDPGTASNNTVTLEARAVVGNTNLAFSTGAPGSVTERARIDSSGNVGIGSNAPLGRLEVSDDAQSGVTAGDLIVDTTSTSADVLVGRLSSTSNDNTTFRVRDRTDNTILYASADGDPFRVGRNGSEFARFDTSGRLLVGNSSTSNTGLLCVKGNASSATGAAQLTLQKGASVSGANQHIGSLNFGEGSANTATIKAFTNANWSGSSRPTYMTFETTPSSSGSPTERIRIDPSGRVGINVASPGCLSGGIHAVHDNSEGTPSFTGGEVGIFQRNFNSAQGCHVGIIGGTAGTSSINFGDKDDADVGIIQYAHSDNSMRFFTNTSEAARIDSSGRLLVGTNTLGAYGTVNAYSNSGSPGFRAVGGSGMATGSAVAAFDKHQNVNTTSQVFVIFSINGQNTGSGQINANGPSQAAFGTFSDRRLKENIVDLPSQLDNVCKLRPVEFDYIKSEGGGHQTSFIAQELEEVYPDAISEREDGMKILTGWGKTEAILVKALQEAVAKIEILEAKVAALEAG